MNIIANRSSKRTALDILIVLAFAVAIVVPIFLLGIPGGNDRPQHYQFAITYRDALSNGNLFLGWSPSTNYGFGDVGVRFYPPLSYLVLAGAEFIVGNWYDASVLVFIFWFFIGGLGIYFWVREWFGEAASLFAAFTYIIAPYHVNQIYNAFTYAEFAAAGILPWCFLFAHRVCTSKSRITIAQLAVSYALLLLTHVPIAILGSLGLGAYVAVHSLQKRSAYTAVRFGVGCLLGLAASAFYWIPVAIELPFVSHARPEFSTGAYGFESNFLLGYFLVTAQDYASRSLAFVDLLFFFTLLTFVPGLVLLLLRERGKDLTKFMGIVTLFCLGLVVATPLSLFAWRNLQHLQMIQFPWRALVLITIASAVLSAAGFQTIRDSLSSKQRPLGLIAAGLIVVTLSFTIAQVIRPAIFQGRDEFLQGIGTLRESKSYECWWPVWAKDEALERRELASVAGREMLSATRSAEGRISVDLGKGPAATMRAATFYYPHWTATVDDQPATVTSSEDGAMIVDVPKDGSAVEIFFQEPNYVTAARILSLLTWAFLIACLGLAVTRKFNYSIEVPSK